MPLYEHVFMSRQDASAQQVEELTNHLKGVIEQMGGKVAKLEQWGVKSLSYRLRKNRKAHYTFMNLDAPPAVINAIVDALRPYGVLHVPMPATPLAVWQAIQQKK